MAARSKAYTAEQLVFLREGYSKMAVRDLTPAFNARFSAEKTRGQIRAALKNHGITCGRGYGEHLMPESSIFSPDEVAWLRKTYKELPIDKLAAAFEIAHGRSAKLSQFRAFFKNHGITCGRTGQFEKGHAPVNKGTKGFMKANSGTFRKGHVNVRTNPIGTERVSKDGYIEIKVAEANPYTTCQTRYKQKHVWLWEQTKGPVPKGHVVAFADGDPMHCVIENLVLLTRNELARLNQQHFKEIPCELKPSVLALTKLRVKVFEREKQGEEKAC